MKQILQNLKSGELQIESVPAPGVLPGHLLIRTTRTLISAGTERMLVDFGRANLFNKAKQQPEKVKQVLRKLKTDGIKPTLDAVRAKLDQPIPLGYCNVGKVIEVGEGVLGYKPGDRVASNGRHAEIVCVPKNLCAPVPDEVGDEAASFTVISSIALQGIRLLAPSLGEAIAVFGLGLIGLVAVQLLRANGARVLGFDFNGERVALARRFGIEAVDLSTGADPIRTGLAFSGNRGVDGVLVTAATQSHDLMRQAAQMSRKRGRIILTGVTGLNLNRSDFYEKELSFQVSCSYGPGRYDPGYEEGGRDYPHGFVRWTENRNFEAVLELIRSGGLRTEPLVTHRFPLDRANDAYDAVANSEGLGLILEFSDDADEAERTRRTVNLPRAHPRSGSVVAGVIGAGNFTQMQMLPVLAKSGARLKWIASAGGVTGTHAARKHGIEHSTTETGQILDDPEVHAVFITTRHNSHAGLILRALEAGKHVFVEKPLCLNRGELEDIIDRYNHLGGTSGKTPILMVGFNRRFSPLIQKLRDKTASRATPLAMQYLCNAGAIPADHWTQDPEIGGGRILGEACHFIDLFRFLSGSPIVSVSAVKQGVSDDRPAGIDTEDTVSMVLKARDGSIATVNYFSCGNKDYPKERTELFFDGKVLTMNNFREIRGYGQRLKKKLISQDKGHAAGFTAFLVAVQSGGPAPIGFDEIVNVTEATLAAAESMRTGLSVTVQTS